MRISNFEKPTHWKIIVTNIVHRFQSCRGQSTEVVFTFWIVFSPVKIGTWRRCVRARNRLVWGFRVEKRPVVRAAAGRKRIHYENYSKRNTFQPFGTRLRTSTKCPDVFVRITLSAVTAFHRTADDFYLDGVPAVASADHLGRRGPINNTSEMDDIRGRSVSICQNRFTAGRVRRAR